MPPTLDSFIAGFPGSVVPGDFAKVSATSEGAATWLDLAGVAGTPTAAATPATGNGEIPTDATQGAFPISPNASAGNHLALAYLAANGTTQGQLILYDCLWRNSGSVGNSTSAQTWTQPALTRYTNGLGVEVWGKVYTAMGATASVFTVTGTDPGNNAATWTYTQPANALTAGQMVRFLPATGAASATGCKATSQLQISISTGTAGNFGVMLIKRIATIPLLGSGLPPMSLDWAGTRLTKVENDACLMMMVQCSTTNTGYIWGDLNIVSVPD